MASIKALDFSCVHRSINMSIGISISIGGGGGGGGGGSDGGSIWVARNRFALHLPRAHSLARSLSIYLIHLSTLHTAHKLQPPLGLQEKELRWKPKGKMVALFLPKTASNRAQRSLLS